MKRIVTTAAITLLIATGIAVAGAAPAQAAEGCTYRAVTSASPDYVHGTCTDLPGSSTVFRINIECRNSAGTRLGKVLGSWHEAGNTAVTQCTSITPLYVAGSASFQFA